MSPQLQKRLLRSAVIALAAFAVGGFLAMQQIRDERAGVAVVKESRPVPMAGASQVGGDFALVDHTGKAVTNENFAGQYKLIYFGFTYCPAICPTELQKITLVMNELGEQAENIQPIFITVDPERDTVEVMKGYVELFHPKLVGLTGGREQIDEALKNYRVYAAKVEEPELNDYTMDHSSFIYLMSPDDQLLTMYRIEDSAAFITEDIQKRI